MPTSSTLAGDSVPSGSGPAFPRSSRLTVSRGAILPVGAIATTTDGLTVNRDDLPVLDDDGVPADGDDLVAIGVTAVLTDGVLAVGVAAADSDAAVLAIGILAVRAVLTILTILTIFTVLTILTVGVLTVGVSADHNAAILAIRILAVCVDDIAGDPGPGAGELQRVVMSIIPDKRTDGRNANRQTGTVLVRTKGKLVASTRSRPRHGLEGCEERECDDEQAGCEHGAEGKVGVWMRGLCRKDE